MAECSLRDYVDQRIAEGHTGIERDRLLRFMEDIADALDYMSEQHSLQHLDIKPENLLMVGDHVKVADFGLTKDLRDVSLSAVAGMTPAYTAPEVFSGSPGRHSDQYSLACVYVLLATGGPAFSGQTTAKLLSQHLHSPADVEALPSHDQAVVLRALSKSPKRRFDSAREFVRALKVAGESQAGINANAPHRGSSPVKRNATRTSTDTGRTNDSTLCDNRELQRGEPIPPSKTETVFRPTLFIGLGGTATSVLQTLKSRLGEKLPDQASSAIRLLAIDTDETALLESVYESETHRLDWSECLPVKLKPSSAYHRRFKKLVEWISRRWLFNIPRSQKTGGIRALGRLAFIDHYAEIVACIAGQLTDITDDETISATTKDVGLARHDSSPRVFIVSSTDGGTGSGMVFDVGYAVRSILRDMNMTDRGVTGVLLHDVNSTNQNGEIHAANAMACFRELNYYGRTRRYSGDATAETPPMDKARPFETTYVVPVPQPVKGELAPADLIAEYLFQSSAGAYTGALDHLRATALPGDLMPKVKSFAGAILSPTETCQVEEVKVAMPEVESEADTVAMTADDTAVVEISIEPTEEDDVSPHRPLDAEIKNPGFVSTNVTEMSCPSTDSIDTRLDSMESLVTALQSDGEVAPEPSLDDAVEPPTEVQEIETPISPPEIKTEPDEPQPAAEVSEENTHIDEEPFSADALFDQLLKTRGNARMLISGKQEASAERQSSLLGSWENEFTRLSSDESSAFVCFEIDGIPVCDLTALIESDSPNCGHLADQLVTRIDIDWNQ